MVTFFYAISYPRKGKQYVLKNVTLISQHTQLMSKLYLKQPK